MKKYLLLGPAVFALLLTGCANQAIEHTVSYPEYTVLGLTPNMRPDYPDCTSGLDSVVRCIDRESSSEIHTSIIIPDKENPFPFKILRITLVPEQYVIGIVFLKEPQTDIESIIQYYALLYSNRTHYDTFRTDYYDIKIDGAYTQNNYSFYTVNYYLRPSHWSQFAPQKQF